MKVFRKILFPFAWLYGFGVWIRNKAYDWGVKSSLSYDFPVICIGNLSVGGTGKSPMIEFLAKLLQNDYRIATLSRGYKRSSKGFLVVKGTETATETGDEPLQFKTKFPEITVAVDENRQRGIERLRLLNPTPEVVLLDDAFQHRKVKAGLSILLTSYHDCYTKDCLLPTGNLREPKAGAKRAQIIIVTKCPEDISEERMDSIKKQLRPLPFQQVFFSTITYSNKVYTTEKSIELNKFSSFTLVTGIANPKPLVSHLRKTFGSFPHKAFPDHHHFSAKEISTLQKQGVILTTEKDFMRLKDKIPTNQLFFLPIKTTFLKNQHLLEKQIKEFVS